MYQLVSRYDFISVEGKNRSSLSLFVVTRLSSSVIQLRYRFLCLLCRVQIRANFGERCFKAYFGVASRICPCVMRSVFILRDTRKRRSLSWIVSRTVPADPDNFLLRAYHFGQFMFSKRVKLCGFNIFWLTQLETPKRLASKFRISTTLSWI